MTISHPSNVNESDLTVLASGVDTLVMSLYVQWNDESLFNTLDDLKKQAQEKGIDVPSKLMHFKDGQIWPFNLKPHGTRGFSWILTGSDFTCKIANTLKPASRPNIMVEIRSEALWRLGPDEAINICLALIMANGATIHEAKLSRLDLCLDFLISEDLWSFSLMDFAVTRATDFNPYYHHMKLTGIRIGKGEISARLYDKPLEIKQQSRKNWMFDIWNLTDVPEGKKIIRIEFQLRREVLKEIGLKDAEFLELQVNSAWAYCTKKWLKFQDRPGVHHTQRKTFDWYQKIQDGFKGFQGEDPAVRTKAIKMDKKRLMQQANGLIAALHAIEQEETGKSPDEPVRASECLETYSREFYADPFSVSKIEEKVKKNRSRYHREKPVLKPGTQIYWVGIHPDDGSGDYENYSEEDEYSDRLKEYGLE